VGCWEIVNASIIFEDCGTLKAEANGWQNGSNMVDCKFAVERSSLYRVVRGFRWGNIIKEPRRGPKMVKRVKPEERRTEEEKVG